MPKISPVSENLRTMTVKIIDRLIDTGGFSSQKSAALHYFNLAKRKHAKTGYDMGSFDLFLKAYHNQKSKIKKYKEVRV